MQKNSLFGWIYPSCSELSQLSFRKKTSEHRNRWVWLLIGLLSVPTLSTLGQTNPDDSIPDSSLNAEDTQLLMLTLPPLETFLERAGVSPTVLRAKAYQNEQEHRLDVTRKEWLNNIRGNANYSYGSMGSMTETSATGQGTYFQYFGENMSLYNVGASLTLPLDLFFGRKDRIKATQSQIEQAKYQVEQTIEEQKLEITQVYAELVANLHMMKYAAEAFTVASSSQKMGEMEYANNSITLQDLSGRRRELALAATSYEEIKSKLYVSIRHLELITGIKLIP